MNFSTQPRRRRDRFVSLALVAGFHLALGWALLRNTVVSVAPVEPAAVEVRLVDPVRLPPVVQPPPVPPTAPRPPQSVVATQPQRRPPTPLPMAVAKPDAALPEPLPASVAPTAIVPEAAAPAPAPAPASAPATPAAPAPASVAIGIVCPTQVRPVMPNRALREGLQGVVTARITLKAGKVIQVDIVNAQPRGVFEASVRQAVQQYRCDTPGDTEVVANQVFDFKLDP